MKDNDKFKHSAVSKPEIELKDFFEFLDPKVVQKIQSTSEESRTRISNDIEELMNLSDLK